MMNENATEHPGFRMESVIGGAEGKNRDTDKLSPLMRTDEVERVKAREGRQL
jgi:hypothetical protein